MRMKTPEPKPSVVVLVVDDDEDHLLMLEALLEMVGYEVVTANSYAAGRRVLEQRAVDGLVSDLSLGDGTALDLLLGLDAAHMPRVAIVLSGFDAAEDVARSIGAGYDVHLAKPTPVELLRKTLADGLRRPEPAAPAEPAIETTISRGSSADAGKGTHRSPIQPVARLAPGR